MLFLLSEYFCLCAAGYTGDSCDEDVDDCASQPCANDGICHDEINDFTCECQPGFIGEQVLQIDKIDLIYKFDLI